ncbi:MAG: hypothetical protein LBS55_02180, partial [Prevotellaceae bacterium]|nr:hypothetical protein [Prevotellaceae bacterium]
METKKTKKQKVSDLDEATSLENLVVFATSTDDGGKNRTVKAPIGLLKGNIGYSAFEVWTQQPGNEDKTEEDYFAFLKEEALEAAATAIEAAQGADTAAQGADTAAQGADTAAATAIEAAGTAGAAAETANTAATLAGNAGEFAAIAGNDANAAAARANTLSDNPPKIQNNFWWFYSEDSEAYVKSDYIAKGDKGEAPRVSAHQTWELYNNETGEWEDTGIDCSSDYVLTTEKVEAVGVLPVNEIRYAAPLAGNVFGAKYLKC